MIHLGQVAWGAMHADRAEPGFEQKLDAALALLASTGIYRSNYAPPLYRFLWWLGVKVPPPHFRSFAANFAITGSYFAIISGVAREGSVAGIPPL